MTLVCMFCDAAKDTAEKVSVPSMCLECGRVTPNERIAPGTYVTFGQQARWFKDEQHDFP